MSKKQTMASEVEPKGATTNAAKPKAEPATKMYVGPTVTGFAVCNTVYKGMPENTAAIIREQPELSNLFIEIADYPKASQMIREQRGYIYSAYAKALELKNNQ